MTGFKRGSISCLGSASALASLFVLADTNFTILNLHDFSVSPLNMPSSPWHSPLSLIGGRRTLETEAYYGVCEQRESLGPFRDL